MKWVYLLLVLLTAFTSVLADTTNLIPNPSFEEYYECPTDILHTPLTTIKKWSQATAGSCDYFHTCGKKNARAPKNILGKQEPRTGEAYAGLYFYSDRNYREYLQCKFSDPLIKGYEYELTFYISLAENSYFAIGGIGVIFNDDLIVQRTLNVLYQPQYYKQSNLRDRPKYEPPIVSDKKEIFTDFDEWVEVTGTYTAKGGEQFLIIGNFEDNINTSKEKINKYNDEYGRAAYYYIDDVSLTISKEAEEINTTIIDTLQIVDNTETPIIEVGQSYILNNIFFEFDKSTLLPKSKKELNSWLDILNENPNMTIEIQGHTDNMGSDEYNNKLSNDRAKAVYDFFTYNEVDKNRLSYKGYGSLKPIASNEFSTGRQQNRRVEFKILSK